MPFVVWLPSLHSLLKPGLPAGQERATCPSWQSSRCGPSLEPWSQAATGPEHLPILDTVPWATSIKAPVQGQKYQEFRELLGFGSSVGRLGSIPVFNTAADGSRGWGMWPLGDGEARVDTPVQERRWMSCALGALVPRQTPSIPRCLCRSWPGGRVG